jgi:lincosamide nucleotidyltransferase A/C/D/E
MRPAGAAARHPVTVRLHEGRGCCAVYKPFAPKVMNMTSEEVVAVLECLDGAGVVAWVDGGWGVDALVGHQTRAHNDLDLALARQDLGSARRALAAIGFRHDENAEPGLPARCVLVDSDGREVDLHPLVFDAVGDGWQQLTADASEQPKRDGGWGRYPAEHLRASGSIGGSRVRCLSAELQMRFHQGYAWSDSDRHDVALLERECGVAAPPRTRNHT